MVLNCRVALSATGKDNCLTLRLRRRASSFGCVFTLRFCRRGEGGAVYQSFRLGRAGAHFGGFPIRGAGKPISRGRKGRAEVRSRDFVLRSGRPFGGRSAPGPGAGGTDGPHLEPILRPAGQTGDGAFRRLADVALRPGSAGGGGVKLMRM